MSKHTPGPWEALYATDGYYFVTHSDGLELRSETDANARLIAAAPDLYAALKVLVPADFDEHPQDFHDDWHAARAAIARAEGTGE